MEHEKGNFDRFLFNGDIIHSHLHKKIISGTRETARFYRSLIENYDVNMGNHELPIMESWRENSRFKTRKHLNNTASGYTKSNSLHFNREMTWELWQRVSLFRYVNGWLVSHAGFGREDLRFGSIEYNLEQLWEESRYAFQQIEWGSSRLFRVGASRGGPGSLKGGPLWRDWNDEFEDIDTLKQLVGHTKMTETVRRKGESYNIDGEQSTYAIIKDDGSILLKAFVIGKGPIIPNVIDSE